MYAEHFSLSQRLFNGDAEKVFFPPNGRVEAAIGRLSDVLVAHDSMAVVTGGPGVGKSAFIAAAHASVAEKSTVLYVDLRQTDPSLLIDSLLLALGAESGNGNDAESLQRLRAAVGKENESGRRVTAVIDVTGLTVDRAKRLLQLVHVAGEPGGQLNVVILGPHALHRLLNAPGLIHLRQRVTFRYRVRPFDLLETEAYLKFQVEQAGGELSEIFADGLVELVFHYVGGVPRLMNTLVDASLSQAAVIGAKRVDPSIVEQVAKELGWRPLAADAAPANSPAAEQSAAKKPTEKPAELSLEAESADSKPKPKAVSEDSAAALLDSVLADADDSASKEQPAAAEPAPVSAFADEEPKDAPGMVPEMDPSDTSATGMLKLEDLDARFAETIFGEDASAAASDALAAKPELSS